MASGSLGRRTNSSRRIRGLREGPGTLVGPRTSVPLLRENATHRGTRPRSYLRHRSGASFLTADRTPATRACTRCALSNRSSSSSFFPFFLLFSFFLLPVLLAGPVFVPACNTVHPLAAIDRRFFAGQLSWDNFPEFSSIVGRRTGEVQG